MVAHSIGVIAIQAGAGSRVIDTQPAQARNALAAIEATSRQTLAGVRRTLGALRRAGPGRAMPGTARPGAGADGRHAPSPAAQARAAGRVDGCLLVRGHRVCHQHRGAWQGPGTSWRWPAGAGHARYLQMPPWPMVAAGHGGRRGAVRRPAAPLAAAGPGPAARRRHRRGDHRRSRSIADFYQLALQPPAFFLIPPAGVAVGFIAATRPRPVSIGAAVIALGVLARYAGAGMPLGFPGGTSPVLAVAVTIVIAWLTGQSIRQDRLHAETLRAQAEAAGGHGRTAADRP